MVLPRYLALLLSSAAVLAHRNHSAPFNWADVKQVFAFGDSYSFVQGTAGYPNFSFIGDAIYNPNWTAAELLSNEIVPKNTSSDGANWLEFLTGCFAGPPRSCTRQLWDFAFAGADIATSLLPLHHNFTVSLEEQVGQFVNSRALEAIFEVPDNERLTAWWIGINDTGDVLGRDTDSKAQIANLTAFWAQEMDRYFAAVERACADGLRGTYLFFNVPPEDRSPSNVNTTKAAPAAASIAGFNAALAARVANFSAAHPDLHVASFDAHAWFSHALDDYAALGFSNVTGYCTCADPGYFWYNSGHPTERVHALLAHAVEEQLVAESKKSG